MLPFLTSIAAKIPIKVWLFGLAAIALTTIITLGYSHYTGLLDEVSVLRANNTQYDLATKLQDETIEELKGVAGEWKQQTDRLIGEYAKLQQVAEDANRETRRLNVLFAEHDLAKLAKVKPGLIERRVNSGSAAILRMFECETSPGGCGLGDGERPDAGVHSTTPSP